ncbi:MAG: cyclic nucleotide-binding and patatin-like phospholipase domain-containing protein [Pseudomonadota bacterium]
MHPIIAQAFTRLFGSPDPDLIGALESRVAPVHLRKGEVLYRQGEPGAGLHILMTGRLQVRIAAGAGAPERVVAVVGPGEAVGEIALFTGRGRAATLVAMRDSTLGFLDRQDFETVMTRHPTAQLKLSNYIIERLLDAQRQGGETPNPIRTFAAVPLDSGCDAAGFARRLQLALLRFGSAALVDARMITARFPDSLSGQGQGVTELERYLDAAEASHDYLVLATDYGLSDWTRKCVTYADAVVFVANITAAVDHAAELAQAVVIQAGDPGPCRELVLVHSGFSILPGKTRRWLDAVSVERHLHIPWAGDEGFDRLARFYSGNAVALVLGGGGARGFAHIGVLRALREAGVPIDAVGGASIGAIVAGGIAIGWDDAQMLDVYKKAFVDDRPTDDYTLPVMSIVQGQKMSHGLRRHFGDALIEDLWIPFFAVSSNLSQNREYVHRRGELWRALRASASLPAIFPPIIEASDLLVDGGILNNLPVDIMRASMRGRVIAVDLSVEENFSYQDDHLPTGWEYFKQRVLSPKSAQVLPTLHRIVLKSTMLGSRREVEAAKVQADLFLNPPTSSFDMLDWQRFHEICEVGYQYAREPVAAWIGKHPEVVHRRAILDVRLQRMNRQTS